MLRQYSGRTHSHLVSLFAAYSLNRKHYLIFPWATCDLLCYWEKKVPNPDSKNLITVRWISYQLWMLVQAVRCIHAGSKTLQNSDDQDRYGRHGDLKPENILWFQANDPLGRLVITDMGLGEMHRFVSRSNVPNRGLPTTPKYRPPECDRNNDVINRSFDIWTLGCIFLEMTSWLIGGWKLIQDMEEDRFKENRGHVETAEYWKWMEGRNSDAVLKDAVHQVSPPNPCSMYQC
ncbi:kinase-like domain-containing protein [Xylariaceae sp. FL0255]|nr:kinase-like domain-containing protein [Xylariaceae sp. FL0255]